MYHEKRRIKEVPRVSDAEWIVMKAVWRMGTATARQVVESLEGNSAWRPKTIHTLLTRLEQKGVLRCERSGREYVFEPVLTEEQCRISASESFLEKVFDGKLAPFLACFLKRESLSKKEIEELKRILEERTS
jgi:BlaI family penicillinase repressor